LKWIAAKEHNPHIITNENSKSNVRLALESVKGTRHAEDGESADWGSVLKVPLTTKYVSNTKNRYKRKRAKQSNRDKFQNRRRELTSNGDGKAMRLK
jgi:hypothetical protein